MTVFKDAQQLAYGVVANISVTGACIVTDRRPAPGSDVDLKLSFYGQPCLYEIRARVGWNRCGGAKSFEGQQLYGVRFTLSSALQKSRLHTLLAGENFVDVFRPDATEFDFLQDALAGEFDELGRKIQKILLGEHDHNRRRQD